jgi:choloylglycine hydrolase
MKKFSIGSVVLILTIFLNLGWACTDFRLSAKDGSVLITRSMEFAMDMKSNVRTSTRGRTFQFNAPDGKAGLTWKAKYGYIYLDGMNIDVAIDGMNEVGLSYEALYLPSFAEYQTVSTDKDSHALPYINLGDWILSNFQTVDEVRKALPNIVVFAQKLPSLGDMIFPLHFAINDASGKGIVVEYVAHQLNIYDNKVGVMTNSPTYDWHMNNLNNYVNLAPLNPPDVIDNAVKFAATGQGYGMLGLPGDISPPSRFVKTTVLTRTALPVDDAGGALNLAEHIINNVDIPRGFARELNNGNKPTNDITQWVVFKDLTNKKFYYRTYGDMSLRSIALSGIDFSENAPRLMMPIADMNTIRDVTHDFIKSTSNKEQVVVQK